KATEYVEPNGHVQAKEVTVGSEKEGFTSVHEREWSVALGAGQAVEQPLWRADLPAGLRWSPGGAHLRVGFKGIDVGLHPLRLDLHVVVGVDEQGSSGGTRSQVPCVVVAQALLPQVTQGPCRLFLRELANGVRCSVGAGVVDHDHLVRILLHLAPEGARGGAPRRGATVVCADNDGRA